MVKERLNYIDFIKGCAILAVVFGHITYTDDFHLLLPIKPFFAYAWHVPVFFIVAGFFLKDIDSTNIIDFIKKKFKQLYLLAMYFYIPAVLLHNFLYNIKWYDPVIKTVDRTTPFESSNEMIKQLLLTVCGAGREPIVGAMWFIYVLLFAMIGYAIISTITNKFQINQYKPLIFFALAIVSGILSNQMDIMIKRCSNVFTAMLLIYIGQYLFQRNKIKFNNTVVLGIAFLMLYEVCIASGGVSLNNNYFKDMAALIAGSFSALYLLGYIGQKIEGTFLERFVRYCGKESFYIMALHLVGFKIATILLSIFGIYHCALGELTPDVGDSVILLFIYLSIGVTFPLVFIWLFRQIKKNILALQKVYIKKAFRYLLH